MWGWSDPAVIKNLAGVGKGKGYGGGTRSHSFVKKLGSAFEKFERGLCGTTKNFGGIQDVGGGL